MVGSIEVLPPLVSAASGAARRVALDPVEPISAPAGRRGRTASGPAPAPVVVDLDLESQRAAGPRPECAAEGDSRDRGGPRPPAHGGGVDSRRSPFATSAARASEQPVVRDAGMLAYRNADGLAVEYAHRGAFFDLSV